MTSALALLLCSVAAAQPAARKAPAENATLTAIERNEVVDVLIERLEANYVFPEVANRLAAVLAGNKTSARYADATTRSALAERLSNDLRDAGNDKHFQVFAEPPGLVAEPSDAVPSRADMERQKAETMRAGFGIARVERLPGNVGYIDVRAFGPAEFVGPAFDAAITLLSGTDAMIVDLRHNRGGEPYSVAHFMSHFFATGDSRHLNDIYDRPHGTTQQFWTDPGVVERYAMPVYVLTSAHTFSAGEECAYDFQTQRRAALVGETTAGGANPGAVFPLGHGLAAMIPTGRAINPVTKTNWEHSGVKPDIAVPAERAQARAYAAILQELLAKATNTEERRKLTELLEQAPIERGPRD